MSTEVRNIPDEQSLRAQQVEHVRQLFPTGQINHNWDLGNSIIIFASGAKIVIDWFDFRAGKADCMRLGFFLPSEFMYALRIGNFHTLYLDQETDGEFLDAIHEILTHKRGPDRYLYAAEREILLKHPWSAGAADADTIYAAWKNYAYVQIGRKPEGAYVDQQNREEKARYIPGFTERKDQKSTISGVKYHLGQILSPRFSDKHFTLG